MHKRVEEYIARARAMGSKTKTLKGAGKWILAQVKPIQGVRAWNRRTTREAYRAEQHRRRLIARYVGVNRLPKYLTQDDRRALQNSPLVEDLKRFRAVPIYARAWYVTERMKGIPRIDAEIQQAMDARGALTANYPIACDAHGRYPWGKLRVHSPGECVEPLKVGVREVGSNSDWRKRSTLERFANYSLIVPKTHGKYYSGWYVDVSHASHTVRFSPRFVRVDREKPYPLAPRRAPLVPYPAHVQRRIMETVVPSVLTVGWDRAEHLLTLTDATGEVFHCPYFSTIERAREAVQSAVIAFRQRRETKIETARLRSDRLFISLDDSYRAGNCKPMSDSFAQTVWREIGAVGPCAVRADIVLGLRDDAYTRRAAMAAVTR